MSAHRLEGNYGRHVDIDVCGTCKVLWLDHLESQQLSAEGVLSLFQIIHQHHGATHTPIEVALACVRCGSGLVVTHDRQRNTKFSYHRCVQGHGRLITFFQFLREKDFVKNVEPKQLEELKKHVKVINCSNCGAAVNLEKGVTCEYCQAALSALDPNQVEKAVRELKQRTQVPPTVDPAIAADIVLAKLKAERAYDEATTDRRYGFRRGGSLVDVGIGILFSILDG
jgi:hypothetical protein